MLLVLPVLFLAVSPDGQVFRRALVIVFQLGHEALVAQIQRVGILPVRVGHLM